MEAAIMRIGTIQQAIEDLLGTQSTRSLNEWGSREPLLYGISSRVNGGRMTFRD